MAVAAATLAIAPSWARPCHAARPMAADAVGTHAGAGPSDLVELDTPTVVRVRLVDGVAITGVVTAWSPDGVQGSFGYRRWVDLRPSDASQLFQRLMDPHSAEQWAALGRALLLSPGGAGLAETAFRRARALDRGIDPTIAAARDEAMRAAANDAAAPPDPDRLRLDDPEARTYSAAPWRTLSPSEQRSAVEMIRQDAEAVLSLAGMPAPTPVESEHLLVYSDLPRPESAALAAKMEGVFEAVTKAISTPTAAPDLWGKALVIVTSDRATFRRLQQRVFLQLDKPDVTAMCHPVGAKVVIVAFARSAGPDLQARLAAELVHGLLHRHVSALRLPPWANEGLAERFAAASVPEFFEFAGRRRDALAFMRRGGDVARIVGSGYRDPGWPGPAPGTAALGMRGIGPSVGRVVVDAMILERPRRFAEWVEAVKRGRDWREAMRDVFGVPVDRVVRSVVEHHRVND